RIFHLIVLFAVGWRPVFKVSIHGPLRGCIITRTDATFKSRRVDKRLKGGPDLPFGTLAYMIVLKVVVVDTSYPCHQPTIVRIHGEETRVQKFQIMLDGVYRTKIHVARPVPGENGHRNRLVHS